MGCICSKLDPDDGAAGGERHKAVTLRGIVADGGGGDDCPNHIVSLTSSTYGVLKLDPDELERSSEKKRKGSPPSASFVPWRKSVSRDGPPEVIDARELMGDLEDAAGDGDSGGSTARKKPVSRFGAAGVMVGDTLGKKKLLDRSSSSSTSSSPTPPPPPPPSGASGSGVRETPAKKKLLDRSSSSASSSPKPPLVPTPGGKQRRPPSPKSDVDKENATRQTDQQQRHTPQHYSTDLRRRSVLKSVENVSPSPRTVLYKKSSLTSAVTPSPTPVGLRIQVPPRYKTDSPAHVTASQPALVRQGSVQSKSRRRSLSPLFDPDLVASWEKELKREKEKGTAATEEQIKRMVSWTPKSKRARDAAAVLEAFEAICPPGGEKAVVLYTTTLRGIRKTFEDCNLARARLEAHYIRVLERDISMDSGYREELRELLGGGRGKDDSTTEGGGGTRSAAAVKVPALFVKGRYVGGAEEVVRLEEEGKLELLLDGVPREAGRCCDGCGGLRFVMCSDCYGSCKVHDEEGQVVKCGECNENGLIHCPICC